MMQRAITFLDKEKSLWGPVFLLCTLALGAKSSIPFDLLFLALAGLYLSARWQLRGCCYALVLLGITAAVKHAFIVTDHLWQLGIEGSLGCAFFITALAFEQGVLLIESLHQQMETRKAALENLEDELVKVRETALSQQIAFQEKIASLQKEMEELQSEHSSLLILNEVLRKTTARHMQESDTLAAAVHDQATQLEVFKTELRETEKTLSRVTDTEGLAIQNRELMKELNAARYEKEQTYLINETIARLYARESLKAKEADQEASSLSDQLRAAHKEVQAIAQPLHEKLAVARNEIVTLRFQFEKAVMDANQGRIALQKLNEVQSERNFLKERLEAAVSEMAFLQQQKPKSDPQLAEQLASTQEQMLHLSQMEPLFKQLKKQFEEKKQTLHQTRSQLFIVDTELQKLKMEKAAQELNPLPKEVEQELEALGEQVEALEVENMQLQELITLLSEKPETEKKK